MTYYCFFWTWLSIAGHTWPFWEILGDSQEQIDHEESAKGHGPQGFDLVCYLCCLRHTCNTQQDSLKHWPVLSLIGWAAQGTPWAQATQEHLTNETTIHLHVNDFYCMIFCQAWTTLQSKITAMLKERGSFVLSLLAGSMDNWSISLQQ